MNMTAWGVNVPTGKDDWHPASWHSGRRVLNMPLGRGSYEQSIKVGAGKELITTFYLAEIEPGNIKKPLDMVQEIDVIEASGYCEHPNETGIKRCGTLSVWTNVWWNHIQFTPYEKDWTLLPGAGTTPGPNTTTNIYRYKVDWEGAPPNVKSRLTWWVDPTDSTPPNFQLIRTFTQGDNKDIDLDKYDESTMYVYISFYHANYLSTAGYPFSPPEGVNPNTKCDSPPKPCYQAFYFGRLRFTPSPDNQIVTLGN